MENLFSLHSPTFFSHVNNPQLLSEQHASLRKQRSFLRAPGTARGLNLLRENVTCGKKLFILSALPKIGPSVPGMTNGIQLFFQIQCEPFHLSFQWLLATLCRNEPEIPPKCYWMDFNTKDHQMKVFFTVTDHWSEMRVWRVASWGFALNNKCREVIIMKEK